MSVPAGSELARPVMAGETLRNCLTPGRPETDCGLGPHVLGLASVPPRQGMTYQ